MTKPKPKKRTSGRKYPPNGDRQFYDFLFGSPARNMAVLAAAVAALFYLNSTVFRPLYESGPPPFPARAEVDKLREETTMSFDSIRKGFDDQAQATKSLTQRIDQQSAETRASRVTRLLAQRVTLGALVEMNPQDQTLKQLLEQTNTQIIQIQTEIARESGLVISPPVNNPTQATK